MPRFVQDPDDPTLIRAVPDAADLALGEIYAKLMQIDPAWQPVHKDKIPKPPPGGGPK